MTDPKLLVSIIIPLIDHREQYMKCLQTFHEQTLEEGTFEIVVACLESAPELQEINTSFPDVRLVFCDEYTDHALYNAGIESSSGRYLYLTECHCFATPTCVAKVIEAAEAQGFDCLNSNSTGANANKYAEMEQRLFDLDVENWKKGTRSKISVRGFLVDRDSWNEVGGFPTEYGHFSELMLGQRLRNLGKTFGYADESLVAHYNQPSLKTLISELVVYGFQECHSNHQFPPEDEQYLCEEWQWYRETPEVVPGMIQRHQRRLRWLATVLRLSPGSASWFFPYYRELWETSIRVGRLNYLKEMAATNTTPSYKMPAAA